MGRTSNWADPTSNTLTQSHKNPLVHSIKCLSIPKRAIFSTSPHLANCVIRGLDVQSDGLDLLSLAKCLDDVIGQSATCLHDLLPSTKAKLVGGQKAFGLQESTQTSTDKSFHDLP